MATLCCAFSFISTAVIIQFHLFYANLYHQSTFLYGHKQSSLFLQIQNPQPKTKLGRNWSFIDLPNETRTKSKKRQIFKLSVPLMFDYLTDFFFVYVSYWLGFFSLFDFKGNFPQVLMFCFFCVLKINDNKLFGQSFPIWIIFTVVGRLTFCCFCRNIQFYFLLKFVRIVFIVKVVSHKKNIIWM